MLQQYTKLFFQEHSFKIHPVININLLIIKINKVVVDLRTFFSNETTLETNNGFLYIQLYLTQEKY